MRCASSAGWKSFGCQGLTHQNKAFASHRRLQSMSGNFFSMHQRFLCPWLTPCTWQGCVSIPQDCPQFHGSTRITNNGQSFFISFCSRRSQPRQMTHANPFQRLRPGVLGGLRGRRKRSWRSRRRRRRMGRRRRMLLRCVPTAGVSELLWKSSSCSVDTIDFFWWWSPDFISAVKERLKCLLTPARKYVNA